MELRASLGACLPYWIRSVVLSVLLLAVHSDRDACPAQCRCLDKSSVVTCTKASYTHVPRFPSTTLVVDLDHNDVSILFNYTFDTAPRIQIVSLEKNGIIHVEAGAFLSLPNLEILRLGKNRISHLPRDVFQANRKLQVLDLHSNSFTEIPDYVLFPLHSLQILNMSYNSLTTPMLGQGFRATKKLRTIDLTGNNLVALESHVFQATLWWDDSVTHHLNLSFCNIQHIFPNSLNQLYHINALSLNGNGAIPRAQLKSALEDLSISSLDVLDLSRMNITDIFEYFSRAQHRNLVELVIAHNRIKRIKPRTFYYLNSARRLDVSHNELLSVDLGGLSSLEHLFLSHNKLQKVSHTTFDGLTSLKSIDLSHNQLTTVSETTFQTLFDLHTLDLGSNLLTSFSITGLETLETLLLPSNRLRSMLSVGMLMKLKQLDMSDNEIDFLGSETFSGGQSLTAVNLSHNLISAIDGNAFADSTVDVLDISYNKLTSLHYYGLQRVRKLFAQANAIKNVSVDAFFRGHELAELDLSGNRVLWLPRYLFTPVSALKSLSLSSNPLRGYLERTGEATAVFAGLHKLETLNLANVGLTHIPTKVLGNLTLLKSLDVSRNKLSSLEIGAFQNISRLVFLNLSHNLLTVPDFNALRTLPHLQKIDFSSNPFQCTCELMPFRNWLLVTNVSVVNSIDPTFYHCAGPAEWKTISILDFHLESATCSRHEKAVIFASIGCTFLLILFAFMFAIYKYKKWSRNKLDRTQYSAISYTDTATHVQLNVHNHSELQNGKEWL